MSIQPSQDELWLEGHAVEDDRMAQAYEALDGRERAVLKKCIARLHQIWGECPDKTRSTTTFRHGFGLEREESPAPFAVLACECSYPSAAAYLAVLLPALLAGVPRVLPCFITPQNSGAKPDHALLAASELAGLPRVFAASEEEALALPGLLSACGSGGRLVALGGSGFGETLALAAIRSGLACRVLNSPPVYFNARLHRPVEQGFCPEPSGAPEPFVEPGEDELFLHLDAAHEDVWLWPELSPGWFRRRKMRLFASRGE